MIFNNKVYDVLKWIAQLLIPALGACYFGLSKIWGFPYGSEIVGTMTIVDLFLGTLLGLSTAQYNARTITTTVNKPDPNQPNLFG